MDETHQNREQAIAVTIPVGGIVRSVRAVVGVERALRIVADTMDKALSAGKILMGEMSEEELADVVPIQISLGVIEASTELLADARRAATRGPAPAWWAGTMGSLPEV